LRGDGWQRSVERAADSPCSNFVAIAMGNYKILAVTGVFVKTQ
jgi:hypothetical protein